MKKLFKKLSQRPFWITRKPSKHKAPVLSPKEEMEAGIREMAKASARLAKVADRQATFTRRMIEATALVCLFALFFYFTLLGIDIHAGDARGVITDLLFILVFGLMLLGRVLDMMREARDGAALRHEADRKADAEEREAELERAREEGRREARHKMHGRGAAGKLGISDIIEAADLPEALHGVMLHSTLKEVINEVMNEATEKFGGRQAAKEAGFEPDETHSREIKRRFEDITGHTVEITWVGTGWEAEIDVEHDDSAGSHKRKKLIKRVSESLFKENTSKPIPKKPGSDDKKKPKKEGKK